MPPQGTEFRDLLEAVPDALVGVGASGAIQSVNHHSESLFGHDRDDLLGSYMETLVPDRLLKVIIGKSTDLLGAKDRVGDIEAIVGKIKAGGHVEHHRTTGVRKDTTLVPTSLTASPIRHAGAVIIDVSRVARDLSMHEKACELVASMIEASQDSMAAISPVDTISDANAAMVKLTGVRRDKLIGTSFSQYFTDPEKAEEGYQKVFAQGTVYPLTMSHQNGQEILTAALYNASLYCDTEGKVLGVFAGARNVTQLRKSAQHARSLIEPTLDPQVTISPEGTVTDVDEATVKATGVRRDKLIGSDFSDYFTDPAQARRGYQQVLEQGSVFDYLLTLCHRDGTLAHVLYNASVYRDRVGNVLGVFASARDVTKQMQVQTEIAAQQARQLDRLAELEPFQRLTVGREVTMIELRKQIEYLKKHNPADGGERADNNR